MLFNEKYFFTLFLIGSIFSPIIGQDFYFGADLSYVNEMEDCGVIYKEDATPKDPFQIFADHNCNLVRLRLWHTPSWYDNLNEGNRYSDFQDVKRSIQRAKAAGMQVLLDFHLSDNWADPSKQLVPAAWLNVVDNLPILKDSLYNYIHQTLSDLHEENLLPEMVQIGNETNKGILLSPEDNAGWVLDWNRNSQLFNRGIEAVRTVENETGKSIDIALHLAGPEDSEWLFEAFVNNGVTDFDIIGMSYYWAWHQPTSIAQTGQVIQNFKSSYPEKEVMIFETGYIWTQESNDAANNIISAIHPDYGPASPENQKQWLIDLTTEVMAKGGKGVLYWEPAWVSSSCYTQWGQGSHQEHATFFDFESNLLPQGGIAWMTHDYTSNLDQIKENLKINAFLSENHNTLNLELFEGPLDSTLYFKLLDTSGKEMINGAFEKGNTSHQIQLPKLNQGIYILSIWGKENQLFSKSLSIFQKN